MTTHRHRGLVSSLSVGRPHRTPTGHPPASLCILALCSHRQEQRDVREDFEVGKVLGEGQYGITREAKRRGGGEVFAVKTSSKKKIVSAAERRETKREIDIMWFLKGHPNRQDSQPRVEAGRTPPARG